MWMEAVTTAHLIPEPKDEVDRILQSFLALSNWGMLHDFDWDRFYRFVIASYDAGKTWDEGDVCQLLVGYRMPEDLAKKLSDVYRRSLLTLKTKRLVESGSHKMARLTGDAT